MSGPDIFALRISNAAAASPANPPPTIRAFIRLSRPHPRSLRLSSPPSSSAIALSFPVLPLCGLRSGNSDRDHTPSELGIKEFRRTQDCEAANVRSTIGVFTYCPSRRIEQGKHADERDDDAAEHDFCRAGRA